MALQFETGMQNVIYQVDSGSGRRIIQVTLFVLFAVAMAVLFTATNFQGLTNADTMEQAQLARHIAEGKGMTTQTIRPFAIGMAARRQPGGEWPALENFKDAYYPPVWPVVLSLGFRSGASASEQATGFVFPADYIPVVFSHVFILFSALLVWLIARKLFDVRVGTMACTAFLISDLVWRHSTAGDGFSAALCFSLAALYAALWSAELPGNTAQTEEQGRIWRWLVPLVVAAVCSALAFLTRYAAGWMILCLFLYFGVSRRTHSWAKACLYIGLTVLFIVPWIVRNVMASGGPFGLLPYDALQQTLLFPGDVLPRSLDPQLPRLPTVVYLLQLKMIGNIRSWFTTGFGLGGTGMLLALFAAMYIHRFIRHSSRTLRWCLLPAMLCTLLSAAAFDESSLTFLALYWPLAIIYGLAFFLILLDRLQLEYRVMAVVAVGTVMFLTGLPLLLNILPPRSGQTYPPYYHRYAARVGGMLDEQEYLITDMPWATAWYGNRPSILLPKDIDEFYVLHRDIQPVSIAYFTLLTRNKPWIRELADPHVAPDYSWYRVFSSGNVPWNFPLTHGQFLSGNDQLILADRVRW